MARSTRGIAVKLNLMLIINVHPTSWHWARQPSVMPCHTSSNNSYPDSCERVMQEIRKIDLAAPSFLEPGRLVTTSMYRSVDA